MPDSHTGTMAQHNHEDTAQHTCTRAPRPQKDLPGAPRQNTHKAPDHGDPDTPTATPPETTTTAPQ
eukprot:5324359-Prorocentrum_lima.AAC.1